METSTFGGLAARELSVEREEGPDGTSASSLELVDRLRAFIASALDTGADEIRWDRSWLAQGGDSLTALSFMGNCYDVGLDVDLAHIVTAESLQDLVDQLIASSSADVPQHQTRQQPASQSESSQPGDVAASAVPNFRDGLPPALQDQLEQVQAICPCSPMQENFLAVQATDPVAYQLRLCCRLASTDSTVLLDVGRVKAAWTAVVNRQPALRTTFVESVDRPGRFDQIVWKRIQPPVSTLHGWDGHTPPRIELSNSQFPHHLTLTAAAENEVYVIIVVSHAVVDGISAGILLRDICRAVKHQMPASDALSCSDLFEAQRTSTSQEAIGYWSGYMASAQGSFLSSTGSAKHKTGRYSIERKVVLSANTMKLYADASHASLVNACQVAYGLVLSCYTGSNDILFSYTTSGRQRHVAGLQDAVGNFINTLPLRINLDKTPTVAQALERAKNDFLESLQYQTVDLSAKNEAGGASLRQLGDSILSFHHATPDSQSPEAGFRVSELSWIAPSDYEYSLGISVGQDQLLLQFDVWQSLVHRDQAERMLDLFQDALYFMLSHPQTPISHFQGVTAVDQAAIRHRNRNVPAARRECLHDLVDSTTRRQPRAPAIQAWDGSATYLELETDANALARSLIALGMRPQARYGLCMEKSRLVPVVMLAILRAGGVVVPLGVQYPLDRVRSIVDSADLSLLFVDAGQTDRLHGLGVHRIVFDQSLLGTLRTKSSLMLPMVAPDSEAWIVYTSGSTGTPKGVVLEHQALCTSIKAHGSRLGFSSSTRTLQFAAHTFDPSIQDIFTTLAFGGCICIPSETDRVENLSTFMHATQVTFACITSTVAAMIRPMDVPSLEVIVLGGEPVIPTDVQRWLPHSKVFNAFGPAECSIHSSCHGPMADASEASTIGFPISSNFWIADLKYDAKGLVPVGAPGELFIEGPILGRGYVNDEARTSEAFIVDPGFISALGLSPGRRMYRTGDIVVQGQDGSFKHLGRRDTQIKIRGQRVEIGEIEANIMRLSTKIRSVCVNLLQRTSSKIPTLVAAVELESASTNGSRLPAGTVIEWTGEVAELFKGLHIALRDILPLHMVPSHYVPLTALPHNASYKIDRRIIRTLLESLSEESLSAFRRSGADGKITTSTERRLQLLWSDVLGLPMEGIGSQAHFFELGADSVVAIRAVALAKTREIAFSVADILQHPQLSTLAALIDRRDHVPQGDGQDDAEPFELCYGYTSSDEAGRSEILLSLSQQCGVAIHDIEDVYPCTPLQESLMAMTSQDGVTYVAQQIFRIGPTVDVSRLRDAWNELRRRLAILRTRIVYSRQVGPVQVVTRETVAWTDAADCDEYLESYLTVPFTYGMPLFRVAFAGENEDDNSSSSPRYFILMSHHSAYDGWSMLRMFSMLAQLYHRKECDDVAPISRFIRYVVQTTVHRSGRKECEAFWRRHLEGLSATRFPKLPSPSRRTNADSVLSRRFAALARRPDAGMRSGRVSLAVLVQAAWCLVVSSITANEDTVLGKVFSGRDTPVLGIEDVVAPTVTTVPVRVRVDRKQKVSDYLTSIDKQNRDMAPHIQFGLRNVLQTVSDKDQYMSPGHLFVIQVDMPQEVFQPAQSIGLERSSTETQNFEGYALVVECTLDPDNRSVNVEMRYDSSILSALQIDALLSQMEHVLQQLNVFNESDTAASDLDSTATVAAVQVLTPVEIQKLLQWNTPPPSPSLTPVHALVAAQKVERPQASAISTSKRDVTYAQLGDAVDRLARHLRSFGVGPGVLVGICMGKSEFAIIAMISVLQAGGACVPIGVQHTDSRIDTILADGTITTVLVDAARLSRFSSRVPHGIVVDEDLLEQLDGLVSPDAGHCTVGSHDAAWVVYTSGSTGVPKGVVWEHQSISTATLAHKTRFEITSSTRALQFAAFTFDGCFHDIFTTLVAGGCICVPSESERMDSLADFMKDMRVTNAVLTPTVAALLEPEDLHPTLNSLVLVGEAITPASVAPWLGKVKVYNGYGVAECSIFSTINGPMRTADEGPVIGYPHASRLWVAAQHDINALAPIGAVGELLVEGPLLGRGYLNDHSKTERAFVTSLGFMEDLNLPADTRMYRTGDLVFQDAADGRFTYVCRRDTQVKIRGQRVELGEIESRILDLSSEVQGVCVDLVQIKGMPKPMLCAGVELVSLHPTSLGKNDPPNGISKRHDNQPNGTSKRLGVTAWDSVQLQSTLRTMRQHLLRIIPFYMVPSHFVPMTLPTNASGKLDRRATRHILEDMDRESLRDLAGVDNNETTLSEREEELASHWAEVLGLPAATINSKNDDFFQLGGDSVTAMRLVAVCERAAAPLKLGVLQIMQNPRLEDMAQAGAAHAADAVNTRLSDPKPFELWEHLASADKLLREARLAAVLEQCEDVMHAERILDVYPATPLQEGLMAITTRQPTAYREQQVFRVGAQVSVDELQRAWKQVVELIPMLRMRMVHTSQGSMQIIVAKTLPWTLSTDLQTYLLQDRQRPFSYGTPLHRLALVTEPAQSYLVWTGHHAAYDGWSFAKIVSAFASLYRDSTTKPITAPMSRFVRFLQHVDQDQAAQFWRDHLQDAQLARFPSLPSQDYQPKAIDRLHTRLRNTTPAARTGGLLRVAWSMTVAAYTGNHEATINISLSGRDAPVVGIQDVVGPTIASVPLRTVFRKEQKVQDLLDIVREQAGAMASYAHLGLRDIRKAVPALGAEWDAGHLFIIQVAPVSAGDGPLEQLGLEADNSMVPVTDFGGYALTMDCTVGADFIDLDLRYDKNVLSSSVAAAVLYQLEHYIVQLDQSRPDTRIGDLPMLSQSDAKTIRARNSPVPPSVNACVHELIEKSVHERGDAQAVCAWDGAFSFVALWKTVHKVAIHLKTYCNVGPEVKVGVCMNKSRYAVVAILAILVAGGAVVPLGAQQPVARIANVISDSRISNILADAFHANRLSSLGTPQPKIWTIDSAWIDALALPAGSTSVCSAVNASSAAWIVYTSGSTGTPKGVVLEHKALCSSFFAHGPRVGFCTDTRALQFSSFTFDNCIEEILSVLVFGGCVCMPSEDQRTNDLPGAIRLLNANLINTTPTVASLIPPGEVPMIKTVLLGGEGLTASAVNHWLGSAKVINTYGPAECSIDVACSDPIQRPSEASTIGSALGVNFWVTEPTNHDILVPIGAPGQLLIEGPHLAREYMNDAAKTSNAFMFNPAFLTKLGIDGTRRMYKTGDLVKQNTNGSLVHLGRIDGQIKIRGQRVEVGEVESAIVKGSSGVQAACVELVRFPDSAEPLLVAAIALGSRNYSSKETSIKQDAGRMSSSVHESSPGLANTLAQIRNTLLKVLPRYMVPYFVPMTTLPQNASNKLDRRATRDIIESLGRERVMTFPKQATIASNRMLSPLEDRLRELWVQVLGCSPDIGATDDFLGLGGDSVTAMRLVAAARSIDIQFGVAEVIRNPSLEALARSIEAIAANASKEFQGDPEPFQLWTGFGDADEDEQRLWLSTIAERCDLETEDIDDVYPATPLQESLMAMTAQRSNALVAQSVFRCQQSLNLDLFQHAWMELMSFLPILRTRIVYHTAQTGTFQVVQRQHLQWLYGDDLSAYLQADRSTEFGYGTLLHRLALITTATNERYFVWTQHHSGYDGYQTMLVLDLLASYYAGDEVEISARAPYPRFIRYLQNRDDSETEAYWREQLEDAVTLRFPPLPDPSYQPHADTFLERWLLRRNSSDSTAGGLAITPLLHAAWAITVATYTGSIEATSTVALSGRDVPVFDIGNMVAPTLTVVPMRIRLEDSAKHVSDLLHDIRRQIEDMNPHIHAGLQRIRAAVPQLGSDFDPGHLFIIQPGTEDDDNDPGKQMGLEEVTTDVAGFGGDALMVQCIVYGNNRVKLELRFDHNLLPVAVADNLLAQFENTARLLETSQDGRLSELPLLRTGELETIKRWNRPVLQARPLRRCVHDLVQHMVDRQSQAPAVSAWDGVLSYAELSSASHKLAHRLRALGVRSEVTVGVCMGKSSLAVVSMFAILLAGGVVVTMDPQHSTERIRTVIKNSNLKGILVGEQEATMLHGMSQTMLVDATLIESLPTPESDPETDVTPDNAAWVIYTSGSTGMPKGVVLEHKTLCSGIVAHGAVFGHDVHTRALQFASSAFCQVIEDVFTTLAFGGCVCIPSDEERLDLEVALPQALERMNVNFAQLTPTVAAILDPLQVPSIKTMGFGGENLKIQVIERWSGHARLINAYGQSECAIESVMREVHSHDNPSNIGFPIAGCAAWVAHPKDYNRLVPIGAPGELLLQGPLLAREYRDAPSQTAASFISSPSFLKTTGFPPELDTRMFRTGDLVQQELDGSLRYLGRVDDQIKVRGQRLEPGEVEYHIAQLDGDVSETFVDLAVPHDSLVSAAPVLVAAVHFRSGSLEPDSVVEPDSQLPAFAMKPATKLNARLNRIRVALSKKLAPYMVPNFFVALVEPMPRSGAGKLDRRAVRSLVARLSRAQLQAYADLTIHSTKGLSRMEQTLCTACAEVLGRASTEMGAQDNFLQLGGDSIAAMRMAFVCRRLGVKVSVLEILQSESLANLALIAEKQADDSSAGQNGVSLLEMSTTATDVQETILRYHLKHPQLGRTYFALDALGGPDGTSMLDACRKLLMSFESFHTGFTQHGDRWVREILPNHPPDITVHTTDLSIEQWTADHMRGRASRTLVPGRPLVDVVICTAKDRHRVLFNMSHAIWDGVCISTIWSSLQALYIGHPAAHTAPFSQYATQVEKRRTSQAVAYWSELLVGSALSSYTPVSSELVFRAAMKGPVSISLRKRCPSGTTCANLVRAAWAITLSRYAKTTDVVFADGVSGRSGIDASVADAVGCASTPIPVRVRLDPLWTSEDLIRHVQDQQMRSIPYETFGFNSIARHCTDWPEGTVAPSFLNHAPVQFNKGHSMTFGNKVYTLSQPPQEEKDWTFSETRISWQQNDDGLDFGFVYAVEKLPADVAEDIFVHFGSTVEHLLSSPRGLIGELLEV